MSKPVAFDLYQFQVVPYPAKKIVKFILHKYDFKIFGTKAKTS